MQTNTKAKQQPKGNNWVLTPEIMVLSILLVATLVVGITVLRGSDSIEPLADIQPITFTQADVESAQLMSNTFDSQDTNYAQNVTASKNDDSDTLSN
ncbi:hypothetical protein EU510_17375 [Pseudoalteromonas sp. FUC4]|uniref:hypothetical protein n=1 Tax=unclassified Pseudoalteromonas TaxID=194690 RepID=UPI0011F0C2C6|nr:hypothetical protein [Pseudoalteromonas sp. FUC4]KAA1150007.1 hypothetical protein EU510_17375 [Pseudoalteromonas sp. FUC4]